MEEFDLADIRDAATEGIRAWAEREHLPILVAHSELRFGVIYVRGQTSYIVEVHAPPGESARPEAAEVTP
jgi:hypothetical protein